MKRNLHSMPLSRNASQSRCQNASGVSWKEVHGIANSLLIIMSNGMRIWCPIPCNFIACFMQFHCMFYTKHIYVRDIKTFLHSIPPHTFATPLVVSATLSPFIVIAQVLTVKDKENAEQMGEKWFLRNKCIFLCKTSCAYYFVSVFP